MECGSGKKMMKKAMDKYKKGDLHSGSKKGPVVKEKKQAEAIGMSEMKKKEKKKK